MKTIQELYAYREMIFSLVRRDLKGRYKGSALGFLWTFINPLLQLGVYTLVFSVIMRNGIKDYYLFLFVALIPWIFFSTSLAGRLQLYMGAEGYGEKDLLPQRGTSHFICYKPVCEYASVFDSCFCSSYCIR